MNICRIFMYVDYKIDAGTHRIVVLQFKPQSTLGVRVMDI